MPYFTHSRKGHLESFMEQRQALITALRKDYGLDLDAAINDVRRYMPGLNEKKFREAFYFAAKAHDGQFRKENKPYMVHPFETARILISFHADEDTLIAAFLHDVPEDTSHTIDEIEKRFGKKVAFLVNGVTKLTKVHYRNDMAGRQVESLKKLFLYTAEDPRIILIKLADRLHNMRTLQHIDKPEKRVRISRETLEIFVPVANLLGIEELKAELEDLCFRYLYPDEYESVADRMQRSRDKNKKVMEETIELIHRELEKSNLKAVIYGRQKNLYGLYKKIISQGKRMDEFDDFIALRILVQEREDCYKVLGILHTLFNPKPGKFRDYISVPKANGYQSLHTTVFGLKGIITEFQIRTNQMHLEAEYGTVARHFDHFEKGGNQDATNLRRSGWMEKIREMEKAQRPQESFLDNLKGDILQDRIFVFTPLGEPIDLPREATCIDFAYAVHTEVGNRALKADINGEILPITTVLKTGDVVRIITSDRAKGPNREWLSFAKTNSARSKIREYFQKESMESKIHLGRQLLQKEYDRAGIGMVRVIPQKKVRDFAEKFPELRLENFNDVLVAIGEGTLGTLDLMHCLYPIRGGALISQRHSVLEFLHLRPIRKKTRVNVRISFDEDRPGQMESLLLVISKFNINILKTEGYLSPFRRVFLCKFVLEIESFQQLSELFENLENVQGVNRVERQFWKRKLTFLIVSMFSFGLWLIHPFIMSFAKNSMLAQNNPVTELFQYFSFFVLFVEVFILKSISARSFPELRETTAYWIMSFLLTAFALITFFSENYFLQLSFNWVVIFGLIVFIVAYQIAEYINANDRS
jgi:GTP pyrophosphokinase